MWRSLDPVSLAAQWRASGPFPHVVIDDAAVGDLQGVLAAIDDEGLELFQDDIYKFLATAPELGTAAMRQLREEVTQQLAPVFAQVCGKSLSRVDLRAFAYHAGHYLLPHTDCREQLGRVLAYIFYLPSEEPPVGGELELYRCTVQDGELIQTDTAKLIEPRPNRLVVFEVSERSLHQVREVMSGHRFSLAGWFYP